MARTHYDIAQGIIEDLDEAMRENWCWHCPEVRHIPGNRIEPPEDYCPYGDDFTHPGCPYTEDYDEVWEACKLIDDKLDVRHDDENFFEEGRPSPNDDF